jgi:hypothetical protein
MTQVTGIVLLVVVLRSLGIALEGVQGHQSAR